MATKKLVTETRAKQNEKVEKETLEKQIMAAWAEGIQVDEIQAGNPIIDQVDFKNELKDITLSIKLLLTDSAESQKEVAENLLKAYEKIEARVRLLEPSFTSKAVRKSARKALNSYAKSEFDFQKNRAMEYIRLAENDFVFKLNLPISSLIEISRLSSADLEKLFDLFDVQKLSRMSYREIKALTASIKKQSKPKKEAQSALVTGEAATPDNVTLMAKGRVLPLENFVRQFESIQAIFDATEVSPQYADDLEKIAQWCLNAAAKAKAA